MIEIVFHIIHKYSATNSPISHQAKKFLLLFSLDLFSAQFIRCGHITLQFSFLRNWGVSFLTNGNSVFPSNTFRLYHSKG